MPWTTFTAACCIPSVFNIGLGVFSLFFLEQVDFLGSKFECTLHKYCMFLTECSVDLSSDFQVTPAQSRNFNQPCRIMNFYDNHDIWHFLSAFSMFSSFMVSIVSLLQGYTSILWMCKIIVCLTSPQTLLTLDDDLVHVPRSKIHVFWKEHKRISDTVLICTVTVGLFNVSSHKYILLTLLTFWNKTVILCVVLVPRTFCTLYNQSVGFLNQFMRKLTTK